MVVYINNTVETVLEILQELPSALVKIHSETTSFLVIAYKITLARHVSTQNFLAIYIFMH